jgi:hypothetical protein
LQGVDQGRALLNERRLVPAQQPQSGRGFVLRPQGPPALTVGAQCFGQAPGIVPVGFVATGRFALPIPLGRLGVDRINRVLPLQQLIHGRPAGGLEGDGTAATGLHLLLELRPTGGGVSELKLGHDRADPIHDNHVVVILGPVQGRKASSFGPISVHSTHGPQRS